MHVGILAFVVALHLVIQQFCSYNPLYYEIFTDFSYNNWLKGALVDIRTDLEDCEAAGYESLTSLWFDGMEEGCFCEETLPGACTSQ